jgi:hypothetical protein
MEYVVNLQKNVAVQVEADNEDEAVDLAYSLSDKGELQEQWDNTMLEHTSVDKIEED